MPDEFSRYLYYISYRRLTIFNIYPDYSGDSLGFFWISGFCIPCENYYFRRLKFSAELIRMTYE